MQSTSRGGGQLDYQGFQASLPAISQGDGRRLPSLEEFIEGTQRGSSASLSRRDSSYRYSQSSTTKEILARAGLTVPPFPPESDLASPVPGGLPAFGPRSTDGVLRSGYDFVCGGDPYVCKGELNIRKSVSHFFGRNKGPTKAVTQDMWVLYCRKHYQRSKYNATRMSLWGTVQHEQLTTQMRRFEDVFICDTWEIRYCSGLARAVEVFSVNADPHAQGIDAKWRKTIVTAYAVREFIGLGRTQDQVWELLHLMKAVQDRGDMGENLAMELLPHDYIVKPRKPRSTSSYTTARRAPSGSSIGSSSRDAGHASPVIQPAPRTRTNRAALNGTGRHSTSSTYPAAAVPRQTRAYHPDVALPGIADLVLPPLDASRMTARLTNTSRTTRRM